MKVLTSIVTTAVMGIITYIIDGIFMLFAKGQHFYNASGYISSIADGLRICCWGFFIATILVGVIAVCITIHAIINAISKRG